MAAVEREQHASGGDEQRHAGDVQPLHAGFERVDIDAQFLALLLELLLHLALFFAEIFNLLLLFRREDEALPGLPGLRLLQGVQFGLRVGQGRFEFLDFRAVALLGVGLHFLHHREGPLARRAAAHGDEIAVAGELINRRLCKGEVAVHRHQHALAAEGIHRLLHRDLVLEKIRVADEHDGVLRGRFLEARLGRRLGFFFLRLGGIGRRSRRLGFAFGKSRLEFAGEPHGERKLGARSFEILDDLLAAHLCHHRVDELRVARRIDEHRLLQTVRRFARKCAGEDHEKIVRLGGEHVVLVHRFLGELERGGLAAPAGAPDVVHVGHDFRGVESHAPRLQQLVERRTARRPELPAARLIEHRERIEKRDELAAAQHELINRVLRRVGDPFRMNQHQHLHLVGDFVRGHLDRLHRVVVLHLRDECPRLLPALPHPHHHRVRRLSVDRQRAHHADHRLFRRRHARDGAGEIVFQQPLAVGREKSERLFLVEHRHAHAEIHALAVGRRLAFDAVELCRILGVRIRLGIELLDFDVSVRRLPVFAEQVFHALRVAFQKDRHPVFTARAVKANLHGRIELPEDRARAG